jgi:HAD-hyrolase-like
LGRIRSDERDAETCSVAATRPSPEISESRREPNQTIFEEAARLCDNPLAGWMVGDSPEPDVAGGVVAELRTIWMSRGRKWGDLDHSVEVTVSTIPEAVEIILDLADTPLSPGGMDRG